MKFQVSRTSTWSESQPCPEAVKEKCIRVDSRTCTESEYDERDLGRGKTWRQEGSNHRKATAAGCKISRDFPDERWFVELATLDDLKAFMDKHGNLVLSVGWDEKTPSIEIYDDYRE